MMIDALTAILSEYVNCSGCQKITGICKNRENCDRHKRWKKYVTGLMEGDHEQSQTR